jgi:hypothetical protein
LSKQFDQLDDQLEQFLDNLIFETKDTDLTPELKAKRRQLADNDDFEFCKTYFPNIFTDPFNDIHKFIANCTSGIYGVSGSRKFGKSAFTYIARYIKPVAKGGVGLIGLGGRTQRKAVSRAESLNRLIKKNKKLLYDYDINFQQDRKGEYIINHKMILTFGKEEGLRGVMDDEFKRFSVIILDDLFDKTSVTSSVDNDAVYDFVTSEVQGALEDDGLCLWLYNMISETSPGKKYSDKHPDKSFNLPALNENDETNWKGSKYTTEKLISLKNSMPYDVWMGDWMNEPLILGDIFKLEWLRSVNLNLNEIIATLTAVDPSHGTSPAACYKAAVTIGLDKSGNMILMDVYLRKEDYLLVFDYLDNLRRTMPNHKAILWENDFSQFNHAFPYYQRWNELTKKFLPIVVYSSKELKTTFYGSDKAGRIMNLVFPFQKGQLLINESIIKYPDYILWKSQYLSFGKAKEKLDGLDATATAFIMLPRYIQSGSFKSLGQRRFDGSTEKSWLHNR